MADLSPPLAAVTPTLSPGAASRLPVELIDLILDYYYADSDYRVTWERRKIAGLCRSWRVPVQRRQFKAVIVKTPARLANLLILVRARNDLGQFIRKVDLAVGNETRKLTKLEVLMGFEATTVGPSVTDANDLLAALPNVTYLELKVGAEQDYSRSQALPHLKTLSLYSQNFDKDLKSFRQILVATPNITSLTLGNGSSTCRTLSKKKGLVPIAFPLLTHLSLQSVQFATTVDKLQLLHLSTLRQVTHLDLSMMGPKIPGASTLPLLKIIGKNITTLGLGDAEEDMYQKDRGLVQACPNFQTLIATDPFGLDSFPVTLTKIIYRPMIANFMDWFFEGMKSITCSDAEWTLVKTFEVQRGRLFYSENFEMNKPAGWLEQRWSEVKEMFAERNVELVMNGIGSQYNLS